MSNFTKGKWEYAEYVSEGVTINGKQYIISAEGNDIALAIHEDDAKLIAAAPKMYNLLQRLIQVHGNNSFRFLKRLSGLLLEAKYLIKFIDITETEG